MREVRGARSAAAARTSLAKAKSDDIGSSHRGGRLRCSRRWRGLTCAVDVAGLPCRSARTLSRGPSAISRPLSNNSRRSTMLQQREADASRSGSSFARRAAPSGVREIRPRCGCRNVRSVRPRNSILGFLISTRARPIACFGRPRGCGRLPRSACRSPSGWPAMNALDARQARGGQDFLVRSPRACPTRCCRAAFRRTARCPPSRSRSRSAGRTDRIAGDPRRRRGCGLPRAS